MNAVVSITLFIALTLLITTILDWFTNKGVDERQALWITGINLLISLAINSICFFYFGWKNIGKYVVNTLR